jgi:chorismate synthase
MAIRFLTAGESHGSALVGIVEGVPAGLGISAGDMDAELKRRQGGYGRGGRMKIESDRVRILSGVRWGKTLGSPIALLIANRDWENWQKGMSPEAADEGSIEAVTRPRPGHADLAGALKYGHKDIRNILERSSARETAMRVALGTVARKLLMEFGIRAGSFVEEIGTVRFEPKALTARELHDLGEEASNSSVGCPDASVTDRMVKLIDEAKEKGDSLGGVFTVFVTGAPPGLGSHVQWDRRLDGRLAQALMSIQAMKGVEVGMGFRAAASMGSEVMDEITRGEGGFSRKSNNAGGVEGGMTNGMPLVLRVAMKPIPTQRKPLKSIDIITGEEVEAAYERSDVCAVPAAAVIGEAMALLVVADAFMEKFGGDSLEEIRRNYESYLKSIG